MALYARYSSDRQSEHSIEDQLRISRVHAEREGWQICGEYHDAAISGSTMLRPGFQALQAAMRRRDVDIVLAEALDRLSRDQEHVAAFHKLAIFTGIRLVTLADGEVSALHVGLKGTMNALFLEDLAAKTRRGLEGRVRAGRATGQAPYGYQRVTGILRADGEIERGLREVVPDHANVVRRIFSEYAHGSTAGVIARRLNQDGVPGPRAAGWNAMSIRGRPSHGDGILRNRAYIGEIVWNRRHRIVDPISGQSHRRLNTVEEQVVGQVPELRIIEDELWNCVQARLSAAAAPCDTSTGQLRFWEKRKAAYLLSGKLVCGTCGGPFAANSGGHYSCNAARRGQCNNRVSVKRKLLERRVLAILSDHMMDPELAEAFAEEFTSEWNRFASLQHAADAQLKRELDAAERKLSNLLDAIADGLRSPGLQAKLSAAEGEQQRLRGAVAQARPGPVRLLPNIGNVYRETLGQLRRALDVGNNSEALERTRSLVERVVIHAAPPGTPLDITVEGHLAHMLTVAQPDLLQGDASMISAVMVTKARDCKHPALGISLHREAGG